MRDRMRGDRGGAVVEFVMVSILLLLLFLGLLQLGIYLHIRNVVTASAAEAARYAANADVDDPALVSAKTADLLRGAVGADTASRLTTTVGTEGGAGGTTLVTVRIGGTLPSFFLPAGEWLPLHVTGHALDERAGVGP